MHIPDGYLGPLTYGSLWAVMIGIWSYASKKVKEALKTSQLPFLAMASAFSFVAMIFTVPLPGGTTAHLSGATLIAVLMKPWSAVIAVSVALIIQALVFGDGGVTAIAANCFNIAFVGSFTGYGVYFLISRLRVVRGKTSTLSFHVVGIALGSYVGINASALLTALELGLQPLIYGSGSTGYFPYPLNLAVPAIMVPHVTLIGILEAIVAALVFIFFKKGTELSGLKSTVMTFVVMLFLLNAAPSSSHDFWIEQKGQDFLIVFGHGTMREDFDLSKIKNIRVIDSQGKDIPFQKGGIEKGLVIKASNHPSVIMAEIDNGYWSKTIYGWKELPKRKASRVVEAIRSLFFTKALISWSEAVQTASAGTILDIVPMKNPFELKAGESLPVKVNLRGKPLSKVEVLGSDHKKHGTTDRDGIVSIPLIKGHNLVTVEFKERIIDDPDADAISLTATLTFEVNR